MIEPDQFDEKLSGGGSGPTICWAAGVTKRASSPYQSGKKNDKESNNTRPKQEALLPRQVPPVESRHRTFAKDSPAELTYQSRLNDRQRDRAQQKQHGDQ
jgi:hypothetical protein